MLINPEGAQTTVLLHGFAENADTIYGNLQDVLPKEHRIIVPNGIFPMPPRIQHTKGMRFSWYFYDKKSDHYYISYDIPAGIIAGLLSGLDRETPVDFIGFSQGGYLAPFCGLTYPNTRKAVCINASLRLEKSPRLPDFPVHCLNGEHDDLVDARLAEERFARFRLQGLKGSFQVVPDAGHTLDDSILLKLKNTLD